MRKYLVDIPLWCFTLLMIAAASITAHGTFTFYSFILDGILPYAATAVLTIGIPLLELAAVLDKSNRTRYIAGMIWLLCMEGVAQYWQGQAYFTQRVLAHFPHTEGIDLVTFAVNPWGRLLPVIYLAALSGIVVYFGYAASARVRDLRGERKPAVKHVVDNPQAPVKEEAPRMTLPEIVKLKDVDGLSFTAIGERLGITRQAAQQRYMKAKQAAAA